VVLPSRSKVAGAQTIKIRYGPYKVPSMASKNVVGEGGGLFNYPEKNVDKPCEACTIVGMQAGLEYPDGTEASINKGMWLHHIVLFNEGPGRQDVTCMDRDLSLPHVGADLLATNSERIWASGNERTVLHFDKFSNNNVGYKVKKEDKFTYNIDLMNDSMDKDVVVYVTTTYDIVPEAPKEWDEAIPVWFDITNCLTSEFSPTAKNGKHSCRIVNTIHTNQYRRNLHSLRNLDLQPRWRNHGSHVSSPRRWSQPRLKG
jgi:hypothetical protein